MWLTHLTDYCLRHDIIAEEDIPWFQYGIEKRVSTVIVGIPVFIVAVLLSDILTATAFYVSFYLLRTRTNGFHASTVWGCLCSSLLCITVFLGILNPILIRPAAVGLSFAGTVIVFILAPYDHPNMNYTEKELLACKKSSRFRCSALLIFSILLHFFDIPKPANGLSLGIAMAAFLLCLAYILNGGTHHENYAGKD